jgi:hypothetical protein
MKYFIWIVLILVISVVTLHLIRTKSSYTQNLNRNKPNEWRSINEVIWEKNNPSDIIGSVLPQGVTELRCHGDFDGNRFIKSNWLVAKITYEDFNVLASNLKLVNKPDLLEIWPQAFECTVAEFSDNWTVTKNVDRNTYYSEDPNIESQVLFKYEGGRVFVKRSTYYTTIKSDDGQLLYKIKEKK